VSARSKSGSPSRQQLLKALDEAGRRLGALTVLVSDLVATRVGLNPTDLECLDLLCLAGATTAGRLASHTGLTSGATTAAIDRLEDAGFVTRRRGAEDRRQVLVDVKDAGTQLIFPFYRPLSSGFEKVHARYTDRQLATVLRYFNDALESMSEHVAWLQTQPALSRRRTRHPVTTAPSRPAPSSSKSSPKARLVGRPARRAPASRNHS
jgi:DNA-binding MarR family transcriptional regulator